VAETSDDRDRLLEQYEAVQASKRAYPRGVPVVVVVSDAAPVDALVAGPAADVLGGPVLPVAQSGIANIVRRELSRLDPRRIVVVGGPGP
jgi:putative cell wall-binding protein